MDLWKLVNILRKSTLRIDIRIHFGNIEEHCRVCQLPQSRTAHCKRTDCPLLDEIPEWLKNGHK